MHRTRTTKGKQGEITGVEAPFDRHGPDCSHHVGIGNFADSKGRIRCIKLERLPDCFTDCRSCGMDIELERTSRQFRRQESQDDICVGDRGP